MHTTILRKVGGSIMLVIPPALIEILHLRPGAKVGLSVESGRLIVEPQQTPRYTLAELLAKCDPKARRNLSSDRQEWEWLDAAPAGGELHRSSSDYRAWLFRADGGIRSAAYRCGDQDDRHRSP